MKLNKYSLALILGFGVLTSCNDRLELLNPNQQTSTYIGEGNPLRWYNWHKSIYWDLQRLPLILYACMTGSVAINTAPNAKPPRNK